MKLLQAELLRKWQEAAAAAPSGREWRGIALSVASPLKLTAAVREPDARIALLLESSLTLAPASLFRMQAEGVSVADQRRPDENICRIAVTLERDELRDVFEVLVLDIIGVASDAITPVEAIRQVERRLLAWQACLRLRRRALSKEEQIGLLGELEILRLIAAEIGFHHAIEAWQGPLCRLHDFSRSGTAVEVKAVLGVGALLYISRFEQLVDAGLSALLVARPRFREDPAGRTLPKTVDDIREQIRQSEPDILWLFNDRLLHAGYIDGRSDDRLRVHLDDVYGFEVGEGFPRITPSSIPLGIVEVRYAIDERSLGEFRRDAGDVRRLAGRMADREP
jgi:hypothetical protein